MKQRKRHNHIKRQRRLLTLESLDARRVLAVTPWTIDLGGSGSDSGFDLFGDDAGGALQDEFQTGGSGTTIETNNVAGQNAPPPTIELSGDASVDEGATYDLTLGAITNPRNTTITEFIVDWGDGSSDSYAAAGVKSHVFGDGPAGHMITVQLVDSGGTHVGGTSLVTVNNVAPTIAVDHATVTVDECLPANNTGMFDDIGEDVISLSASVGTVMDNGDGSWRWFYDTTDGPDETQQVTVTVTDSDGAAASASFNLTVNNKAPEITADVAMVTVDEGQTAVNSGDFADHGVDTVTLDATDGEVTDNGDGTWTWSLATTDGPEDSRQVTVTATDSDGAATDVTFDLTVNNVAPAAANHTFDATGNVPIHVAVSELLAGATDPGDHPLSVSEIDATSANGGSITVDDLASGSFTYTPPTGFTGIDTFDYAIFDGNDAGTGTVTVNVQEMIWFVDNNAETGGDGSLDSPFDSFAPLNDDGNDPDNPGDVIFVAAGETYNVTHGDANVHDHGLRLEDGQILIGEGADHQTLDSWLADKGGITVAANSVSLPSLGGEKPHITNTTGDVVTVANGNTITGVMLDPVASAGIAGEGVEGLVVEFVIIITSGGTNDNEGIRLTTVSGTLTFTDLDIGSEEGGVNNGTAIQIDGGTAQLQFNNVDIDQDGGSLLSIVNTFASTLTFDENSELTLTGSDEAAVTIASNHGGTVVLNNDGINVDTTTTVVFNIVDNSGLDAITPVNDAPRFNIPGQAPESFEDGGPQTVAGFATDISPGAGADEVGQTLTFTVTNNDNAALFAVQPAIDTHGNLTYTAAPNASGFAQITLHLRDDGGTADGGVDTSDVKKFSIIVTPTNDPPELDGIADQSTDENSTITFTAVATDIDGDGLQFSLSGAPVGAAITPGGQFTWTPTEAQAPGSFTFDVIVSDGELADSETITVTVNEVTLPTIADVIFDIAQAEILGQTVYFSYLALEAVGPDSGNGTRIDLKRVNDGSFIQSGSAAGITQEFEFVYETIGELLAAHNGIHEFGIDNDGDGNHDDTFTIDVNLDGFTSASFPDYANVTGPSGTIDETTPTITWDAIPAADGFYISANAVNGPTLDDIEEVWFTDLPAGSTSVTTGELQAGQTYLAGVQANFLRSDLATAGSTDGEINLSFFTNSISASEFEIAPATGDPPSGEAEMFIGFGEQREGGGAAESLMFFDLSVQHDELIDDSRVYLQSPGGGPVIETDGWVWDDDHDGDPNTPAVKRGGFFADIEQGDLATETFLSGIDGNWTVLLDFDGNFDPNSPVDDTDDAKFTFDFDVDSLPTLSPQPTITSPQFNETLDSDDNPVTITWDVAPGNAFDGIDIEVFIDDDNGEFDAELTSNARSATIDELPTGTPLFVEVTTYTEGGNFAGDPQAVAGFASLNWEPVGMAVGSIHIQPFEIALPPVAEVFVNLYQADFGDDGQIMQAEFDFDGFHDQMTGDTRLYLQTPQDAGPVEVFDTYLDIERGDGQTTADFLASLDGEYLFAADFDDDGSNDLEFGFVVDTSGLGTGDFPTAPVPTSPAPEEVLGKDEREVTFSWQQHATADSMVVYAEVFDVDVDADETSVTSPPLPTGTEFFWALGAFEELDIIQQTSGGDPVAVGFAIGTFTPGGFSIEPHTRHVSPDDPCGFFGGGPRAIGGLNYEFTGLTGDADFKAEYFLAEDFDGWRFAVGGDDRLDEVWGTFDITNEQFLQTWQLSLIDDAGNDADFTHVDMRLKYDESAIDLPYQDLDDIEENLHAYQFNETLGDWEPVELLARDPWNNEMTVRVERMSPLVLGYNFDLDSPDLPRVPDDQVADFEFVLQRFAMLDGSVAYSAYMEVGATSDNVRQDTRVELQGPSDAVFSELDADWGRVFMDDEFADTLDELTAGFDGTYQFRFDYDNDGTHDEEFSVEVDLSGLTDNSFLTPTPITSPSGTITDRTPEITWDLQDDADFLSVGIRVMNSDDIFESAGVFTRDVSEITTSIESSPVPGGEDLIAFIGATVEANERITHTISANYVHTQLELTSYSISEFTVSEDTTSVPAGDSVGTSGGVDFDITGVASPAEFKAESFVLDDPRQPDNFEAWETILGGFDPADAILQNDLLPHHTQLQAWTLELTDVTGDVAFTDAELIFTYDASLIDVDESDLQIYQWSDATQLWQPATLVNRDTAADTITVNVDSHSTVVLGRDLLV